MRPAAAVLCALVVVSWVASPAAATDPPSGFQGDYDLATDSIVLSWDEVPGVAPNPTVYTIYRNGDALATTTSLTYSDPVESALPGIREYQVTATVAGVESLASGTVFMTTLPGPLTSDCPFLVVAIHTAVPPGIEPNVIEECIPLP